MESFIIHDNGGRPRRVNIEKKEGHEHFTVNVDKETPYPELLYKHHFSLENVLEVWPGCDTAERDTYLEYQPGSHSVIPRDLQQHEPQTGNTVLVKLAGLPEKYILIGPEVKQFELIDNDKVARFISPLYGSDVPYPQIIGEKYTYILAHHDCIYIENSLIPGLLAEKNDKDVLSMKCRWHCDECVQYGRDKSEHKRLGKPGKCQRAPARFAPFKKLEFVELFKRLYC